MSLFSITQTFQTEDEAQLYLMTIRFPNGIRCLACECPKCYLIETKGKMAKVARLFECSDCGLHFSSTTGTLFHELAP